MSSLDSRADVEAGEGQIEAAQGHVEADAPHTCKPPISLHGLMDALQLDDIADYTAVPTEQLQRACAELDGAQLLEILNKYIGTDDMFTQQYLHGVPENIKLLVDIGEAVESPEAAAAMHEHLSNREPLFVRSLVAVFQAWHDKTWPRAAP